MKYSGRDQYYMRLALILARDALGTTSPNPAVGCIIVNNNEIVGQGITQSKGRPHAETIALGQAGTKAKGATAYVTLEPCAHFGNTPPCSQNLIDAGIAKIFIAVKDPCSKVNGAGIEALQQANIEVIYGLCEEEAAEINQGFFTLQQKKRPFITLKLATSIDGKIATKSAESKWITSEESREYVQYLRSKSDAILVGINTVLADDPLLTCRLPGMENRKPIRIILDTNLRIKEDNKIIQSAKDIPTWIYSSQGGKVGEAEIIQSPARDGRLDLQYIVDDLGKKGITRLLIEGGSKVATSFLKANLVDELIWIKAPILIGNDGYAAIGELGTESLSQTPRFKLISADQIASDLIEVYYIVL